jgi:hypothetical protein
MTLTRSADPAPGRRFRCTARRAAVTAFTYVTAAEPGPVIPIRRLNDRWSSVGHLDAPGGRVTYQGELPIVLGALPR